VRKRHRSKAARQVFSPEVRWMGSSVKRCGASAQAFLMASYGANLERAMGFEPTTDVPSFISGLCPPCGPFWTGLQTRSG
jgi:hypothetical protein